MRFASIAMLVSALPFAGCGGDETPLDPASPEKTDGAVDGSAPDRSSPADAPTLEAVAHTREFRAVWVGSVHRLDFPSSVTLTPAEAKSELAGIVDVVADAGLNAILFQVRPESDALYVSSLDPWSRFLTGTQGTNPGYDPLALLIEAAHAKGIEVHAWVNPLRAQAAVGIPTVANHVTKRFPDAAITYNGAITMNPADSRVRDHVVAVVTEITRDYDIDGVVFDDYFYPYPAATPYPDEASYTAYVGGGGTLGKSDWRRDNVNRLISAVATAIRSEKSWVRWGVSPFGIYRPGMPAGITGIDAFEALACDSVHWMKQDWVDYLAPQLYWPTGSTGQPYGKLIAWWASQAKPGRPIVSAMGAYNIGTTPAWTAAEYESQIALARAETNVAGQAHYRYASLETDVGGIKKSFKTFYASPARPPVVPGAAGAAVVPPVVTVTPGSVGLAHAAPTAIRGYAAYRALAGGWEYARWLPATLSSASLSAGRYAISAIDRGGVESLGVVVNVP